MGIADELLALAGYLATSSSPAFEQASFRRSVSTAYYALFHLLVSEAAQHWNGSTEARFGLERAFKHANMKEISEAVSKGLLEELEHSPAPDPSRTPVCCEGIC
jgi:hypothetical protein